LLPIDSTWNASLTITISPTAVFVSSVHTCDIKRVTSDVIQDIFAIQMPYTTHPSLDVVPTFHLSEGIFSRMRELACTTELQSYGGSLTAGRATYALQV
jgi:hypothetical protein